MPEETGPTGPPCRRCSEQIHRGPSDPPHFGLRVMKAEKMASAVGGWIETLYRCDDCGRLIRHTTLLTAPSPYWRDVTPRKPRRLSHLAAFLWLLESASLVGEAC